MVRKTGDDHLGATDGWLSTIECPRCKRDTPRRLDRCRFCGFSFRETRTFESADSDSPEALIGTVINDKYRVVSVLGQGGFGVVYRVEFLLFESRSTFALKLLHPALSQDPKFRRRFLREAALTMRLIHENTIQIREFGKTEDGSLFFTMDFCEGEPLSAIIGRERFLSVHRSLAVVRQVLSVIKQAHAQGIVHRDLKPENIFLERRDAQHDFVKVGDFGLAKSYLEAVGPDISHGGIVGTPRYMSPEQARGQEDLDHRSDLFSIGIVLYEMLYGEVPDVSPDGESGSVPTPTHHPDHLVPRAVWEIVHRATATRREDRFQTADEFLAAVAELPDYSPALGVDSRERPALATSAAQGSSWWRSAAWFVALLSLVAVPLSLNPDWIASLIPDPAPTTSGPDEEAFAIAVPEQGSAKHSAPAPAVLEENEVGEPSARVGDYLALKVGDEFRFTVYDEQGSNATELIYRIAAQTDASEFTVYVSTFGSGSGPREERLISERRLEWVVDTKDNVFYQQFLLPDPDTGEVNRRRRSEALRLPKRGDRLEADFDRGNVRVHRKRAKLGRMFKDCLVVQSVEGLQRRLQYYKEGVGLVGLEVYAIDPDERDVAKPFVDDLSTLGRRVYGRYLQLR